MLGVRFHLPDADIFSAPQSLLLPSCTCTTTLPPIAWRFPGPLSKSIAGVARRYISHSISTGSLTSGGHFGRPVALEAVPPRHDRVSVSAWLHMYNSPRPNGSVLGVDEPWTSVRAVRSDWRGPSQVNRKPASRPGVELPMSGSPLTPAINGQRQLSLPRFRRTAFTMHLAFSWPRERGHSPRASLRHRRHEPASVDTLSCTRTTRQRGRHSWPAEQRRLGNR